MKTYYMNQIINFLTDLLMKKHYLRLLSVMLCALFCSTAFAERLAYGITLNDVMGTDGFYICSFNAKTGSPETTYLKKYEPSGKPLAAEYAEDAYYMIGRGPVLLRTDLENGAFTTMASLTPVAPLDGVPQFYDLAYDVTTQTMYGIGLKNKVYGLYTLNLTDATVTFVANLEGNVAGLGCSKEGQLYGVTVAGVMAKTVNLVKIDKTSGAYSNSLPVDVTECDMAGGAFTHSVAIDHETGKLYWAYTIDVFEGYLAEVDVTTGAVTVKHLANDNQLVGLCFAEVGGAGPIDPDPVGARTAFGFSLSAASDQPTPWALQSADFRTFDANAAQDGTRLVKKYALTGAPQAAAYVNEKDSIYLMGEDADGMFLYRMDTKGENYTRVGTKSTKITNVAFRDMAYDPMNKIMYAVGDSLLTAGNKSLLFKLNLTTGVVTGGAQKGYLAIAALKSGQLLGIAEDGQFGIVYPFGSNMEKISTLDTSLFDATAPMDLEFDLSTLTLYWSYTDKEGNGHLAIIDPATGKVSNNNEFKDGEPVIGLYFPTLEIEPSATWYAFSMYSNTHDEDMGFVTLDPANLASVTPIGKFNTEGVGAAAGANGIYYAVRTVPNGYGAKNTDLATVNLENGTMTNVATLEDTPLIWDMTYDYSTGEFYAISMEGEPDPSFVGSLINTYCRLYSIDVTGKEWTPIAKLNTEYRGIACTMDGQLYGFTQKGELRKLNKLTGAYETVMETGIVTEPTFPASMEFDQATGALYCSYFTEANKETGKRSYAAMSQFDYVAKKVVDSRIYPGKDKLCGLYIPFERAAGTPAKIADLTVTPGAEGALTAALAWTNPSKTYGNETLTAVTKVEVLRDGTVIATLDQEQTPGKANTYTDEQPTLGFHNYVVNVYNGEEVSEPAAVLKFIGEDVPAAPANVVLTVNEGAKATLTWEAPTTGLNTGWFNPDKLTYTIVRQPDNKTLKLDYKGTSIEDEVPMMNYYTYHVTAFSTKGKGGEGVSNSETVGTAFVPPYSCDFLNDAEAGLWTLHGTWKIDNFGMGENYRGLIHGWEETCNSWAYSPLIQFRDDKSYNLTFKARSAVLGPKILERVRITAGLDRTPEAQTVSVAEVDSIGGGKADLTTYSIIFNVPAKDVYYLGFFCTSFEKLDEELEIERMYADLQVSNITVVEIPYIDTSIEANEAMNDVFVYAYDGKIHIEGEYTSAMVYNQVGAACPTDAQLAAGIYIVKVTNGDAAKTYKVFVR